MTDDSQHVASLVEVWSRRAVTITCCALVWLFLIAGLPLMLFAAAVVDFLLRRQWVFTRCVLFFPFYFTCEIIGIAASLGIWLANGVLPGRTHERFLDWNFALQRWWANALCRGAQFIFDITIDVEGGDEIRNGPIIVFLRHASVADTLLPAIFIANPNGLRLRYVLKHELLLDPCLDIVGNRLPNAFVRRSFGDSFRVADLMEDLGPRDGVIIYPEGTRYSESKRERLIHQLDEKGDVFLREWARALTNVLPPRLGGSMSLLEQNNNADVVFCAHFGFDGVVDLRDFLRGSLIGRVVNVKFWRVPFVAIPLTREERRDWLFENWARVDEWVGLRKTRGVVELMSS
jgi:1-acyl-sn-glycerol-3-phosphate acyltransferase